MYIADLVSAQAALFGPIPDFNMQELEITLKKVVKLPFDRVVFSHTAREDPLAGGNKKDIENALDYIADINAGINDLLKKGTPPFAIPGLLKPKDRYKNWRNIVSHFPQNVGKFVFERVIGPYPWRETNNGYSFKRRGNNRRDKGRYGRKRRNKFFKVEF